MQKFPDTQEYLEPEDVPSTSRYHSDLSARDAFADDVVLRVTVSPSFSAVCVIGMRDATMSGSTGHSVFYLRNRFPEVDESLPLADCTKPIDAATAQLLSAAWIWMLRDARHPQCPRIGLDGTTYQFYADTPEGALAGQTWSPEPDSNSGRLVELAEAVAHYCNGKLDEADLQRRSTELCGRLGRGACRN
ncbi:MAG: hypothetical protein FWD68_14050 [Alphaproteobacteria bacterium]|nr:hypothetical protein [Alphaproteobacteria bacterium]